MDQKADPVPAEPVKEHLPEPADDHRQPVVELHNPFEQFDFEPPYGGDF